MSWLEESDLPACRAWAELEILSASVFTALTTDGFANVDGEPRKLLTEFRQLRQSQLAYERELGMTPAARMAIKAKGTRAVFDRYNIVSEADLQHAVVRVEAYLQDKSGQPAKVAVIGRGR